MAQKKKYWSKRRRYGWGWAPVTWQGWTTLGIWLAFVLFGTSYIDKSAPQTTWIYLSSVLLSIIPLILVFYKTGPVPKWRWGKKDGDDPSKDW